MSSWLDAHRDAAADRALVRAALHAAAQLIDGEVERDAQFLFVDAGLVHVAGHAEELGAGR